jgi:hypothetical protein
MSNGTLARVDQIGSLIRTIRGQKVILDSDLALIYGVPTKVLNKAVKRNLERFPDDFIFQLSWEELENLRFQIGTSSLHGGRRYLPYAFTENGAISICRTETSIRGIEVVPGASHFLPKRRPIIIFQRNRNHPMPKLNLMSNLVVGLLLFFAGVGCAQTASGSGIDAYDGFETARLSKVWSTDRLESGAVMMQTNIVRAGRGAVKITVQAKDKFESGINGNKDTERDELLEAGKLFSQENVNYEQSFSMFIPTNFPIVPTRLVIAQWKQFCPEGGNCSDDSPVLAIRYLSGKLRITQNLGGKETTVLYQEKAEFRGRWLDFKFQVRFSPKENGQIKAWLGDKQLVDFKGVTANPENATTGYPSPSRFYFKMGLYRDVMPEPMTLYLDEYRKKQLPADSF